MRVSLFIGILLTLLFQGCTMMTNSFGPATLVANAPEPYVYQKESSPKITVSLDRVASNDFTFMERINFIRTLKDELNKTSNISIGQSTLLHLKVVVNKYPLNERKYKIVHKGFTEYHQDIRYKTNLSYTVTDRAGQIATKGVINYNVLVKASSYAGFEDAKRVGLKKLSVALAKRLARDLSARASILASKYKYSVR